MSDAVLNVMKYRGRLKAEIAKVDGFLQMAEDFSKGPDADARVALTKAAATAPPPEKPKADRPRPTTNGSGTA
jgi:hypothetical protein